MALPPLTRWPRATWQLLVELRQQYADDGAGDIAASVTFWVLLSIPAGILAMVSALGWLGGIVGADLAAEARTEVVEGAREIFAGEAQVVVDAVDDLFAQPNAGLLTSSIALAIFSLSRGFDALIRGLSRAYDVEKGRSWYHRRLVAVGLSIGSLVTVALTVAVQVALARWLPEPAPDQLIRWLVAFAVLVAWAATMYHAAPFLRSPWRYDLPGAILAAVVWALVSAGYELYIRYASGQNQVLGAIGGAVLALTWLYAIMLVLVVGAELNAVLARRAGVIESRRRLVALLRSRFGGSAGSPSVTSPEQPDHAPAVPGAEGRACSASRPPPAPS